MALWTRLSRHGRAPWLLAAASLTILAAVPAQYFGRQHDDVLFVIASRALSDGHYGRFISPGSPPLVDVWPGLPALLLPVTWMAGEHPWAYQLFMGLLLAACPWAIWWWLRPRAKPAIAALVPLLFATSPLILSQAGCVMPEAPYTLLTIGLLIALEKASDESTLIGWLTLAAVQVRSAGLSLLPALLARPLLERRWGDIARRLWPAALGCLAWGAWCFAQSGFVQEASEWAASYEGRASGAFWRVPLANARYFSAALGGCFLPGRHGDGPAAVALGAALIALCAYQALRLLRRRLDDPLAWMLIAAGGMHLFWGWQYERYWIPLLPLALWTASEALGDGAPVVLGALLAAQLAFHTGYWLRSTPWSEPEMKASYAWLREHSAPGDVLSSALYARDGFYASRPSLPLADRPDARALAELLKKWRVRYVLWQELDLGFTLDATAHDRRAIDRAGRSLRDPGLFRPVFDDAKGGAVIYEVR